MTTTKTAQAKVGISPRALAEIRSRSQSLSDFGVEAEAWTIWPADARLLVAAFNPLNRPPQGPHGTRLARDMAAEHWDFTGQGLIIGSDGVVYEGYQRLLACIDSDTPFTTLVVIGIDPHAVGNIDRGLPRSIANVLHMDGAEDATILNAAENFVWRHKSGWALSSTNRSITVEEAREIRALHPELAESIAIAKGMPKGLRMPPGQVTFLHWWFAQLNGKQADDFFAVLGSGRALGGPVLTLRDQLLSQTKSPGVLKTTAWTIKAWNAYRDGRDPQAFRYWAKSDTFPEPH